MGQHYDDVACEYEVTRLEQHSAAEREMTERYLERFVPSGSTVADVGVGHYDELLARRRCRLHLVDVSARLLETALGRLESCGLSGHVLDAQVASATDLAHLSDASWDAVLLLGPLCHLLTLAERQRAVREARRVLRGDGLLAASGCNRIVGVGGGYYLEPERCIELLEDYRQFVADGIVEPDLAPTIGHAHFTGAAEFRALFEGVFEEAMFVGIESFTGSRQKIFSEISPDAQQAWLDLVEATAATAEGIGLSEHFLFIGRPQSDW